jgi:hypothetical protein
VKRVRFEYKGVKLEIWQGRYDNGHTALFLVDPINMTQLAALTVNIPDFDFPTDELAIKAWSENEEIADICFQTGIFEDTAKRAENDEVTVEFWKIREPCTLDQLPMIKQ